MCGSDDVVQYPAPLQLYGRDLPWVLTATHLGHELHQTCSMSYDIKCKKGKFISDSIEIRETFDFADPVQVLKAIQVYCGHSYGAMLYNLFSDKAGQLYRSWSTCTKLVWKCPRATKTFLVQNLLAVDFIPVRVQLLTRFVKFFQQLLKCHSREIMVVANIVARDVRSTTGYNVAMLERETGLSPWDVTPGKFKEAFPRVQVPHQDEWRIPYLRRLLKERYTLENNMKDTDIITELIDSLCMS